MIVYGWNSSSVADSTPTGIKCPNCEEIGTTSIDVRSRYAHIFWIPIFPYGKMGYSHCSSCGHELKKRKMTEEMRQEYNDLTADTRPPFWQFGGAIAILCAVLFFWSKSNSDHKTYEAYIKSPQIDDVYRYTTEDGNYSTYKVLSFTNDSIDLLPNMYEFTEKVGIEEIESDSHYADFYYTVSRDYATDLFESDTIYTVLRSEVSEDDIIEAIEAVEEDEDSE